MAKKEFVNSFEEACEKLNRSTVLPDVSSWPEHYRNGITARYKLETIAEANGGGEGIDWKDDDQQKWYPWMVAETDEEKLSGFGLSFDGCGFDFDLTCAALGSRLYFKDRAAAEFMGRNFTDLYEMVLKG